MDDTDRVEIEALTLDKREDVKRFIRVCRNAHWAPYTGTMPANVVTIRFMSNGRELYRLVYGEGWLLESSGEGTPRFGTISSEDGEWVDDNIDTPRMLLFNTI